MSLCSAELPRHDKMAQQILLWEMPFVNATPNTKQNYWMKYNSRHGKTKSPPFIFDHNHSDRIVDSLRPQEKSLDRMCRSSTCVNLVLAAEAAFIAAAFAGRSAHLKEIFHAHPLRSAHRHRLLVTYLPLSLIAMQANWNGLFPSNRVSVYHHLCSYRRFTPTGSMAFKYRMADLIGKYSLHHHCARPCNGSKCNAPASISS